MQKKIYSQIILRVVFIFLICFLCVVSPVFCSPGIAQDDNKLRIFLYEYSDDQSVSTIPKNDNLFLEGNTYGILVVRNSTNEFGETRPVIAYGVRITVPWDSYMTSEAAPEVRISAPRFDMYREFVITASKPSFPDEEMLITVIKGKLNMVIDRGTVEEGRSFQVTVHDQNDDVIPDCLVYIQTSDGQLGDSDLTNTQGVVYLSAPSIKNESDNVSVIAYKDGYVGNTTGIRVEDVPVITIAADLYSILPIVIAIVVVIVAMVIVHMRKTAGHPEMVEEIEAPPLEEIPKVKKHSFFSSRSQKIYAQTSEEPKSIEMSIPVKGESRVEEIRIPASTKRKETMYISAEKEPTQTPRNGKKPEEQVFEGTDELRYTIDRLTGKIDEKQKDRWFEGTTDVRKKVDEAINKKYKKKDQK